MVGYDICQVHGSWSPAYTLTGYVVHDGALRAMGIYQAAALAVVTSGVQHPAYHFSGLRLRPTRRPSRIVPARRSQV